MTPGYASYLVDKKLLRLILDPSAVGVHNENSAEFWSTCTYLLKNALCYALHLRRNVLLANVRNEYASQSLQHI